MDCKVKEDSVKMISEEPDMEKYERINKLKFVNGLIPVVIQDYSDQKVLMVAYMNREALELTVKTGQTHFYSRSRNKLWKKGEMSGHVQSVKEILMDCDEDTLLIKVEQKTASCHAGYKSCFYRKLDSEGNMKIIGQKVFEPGEIYK
jgi:phosphoribosyl-AMP cyclohydrolase